MADANQEALIAALNNLSVDPAEQGALLVALEAFTSRMPDDVAVAPRVLVPSIPAGAAAGEPVLVEAPSNEATIIDARSVEHPYLRLSLGYAALLGHSHVYAGALDNIFAGDSAAQDISAGEGNDIVFAGGGNDTIFGQDGIDFIHGNAGADMVNGNTGIDTIYGGRDADTLFGGQDDDIINGNLGDDLLNGNRGNDEVQGGQGNDEVHGGQGDDAVAGNFGDDRVWGDLGNDTMFGGDGIDNFYFAANSGKDVVVDFAPMLGERIVLVGRGGYTLDQDAIGTTIITFSSEESITLTGVRRDMFSADWIISQ